MQNLIEIDEALAKRVKETVSHGLCKGLGKPILEEMCVEAAVNYACGFPHGDNPSCVGSAVRGFKIKLNDARWSSNEARAKGMLKIAIAQLGSNTIDQKAFSRIVAFKTITTVMPIMLRARGYESDALLCENSKDLAEAKTNIWSVKNKLFEARKNAYAAYAYAYAYAADKILTTSANICLEALIELKSPGCEFLYLCSE